MGLFGEEYEICPHCGHIVGSRPANGLFLPEGTVLANRYITGKSVGNGGFGITYIAFDITDNVRVAIKEYLPTAIATRVPGTLGVSVMQSENKDDCVKYFTAGVDKFIEEANILSTFNTDPSIVHVFSAFRANGTAYMVMEFLDGETIAQRLKREKQIPPDEAVNIVTVAAQALSRVHAAGLLHRDIAPDNIILTKNYKVKLIDFGSARYSSVDSEKTLTVMIKHGFSAPEQYRRHGERGPFTDVYSLGATLYKMISGVNPPDALERTASIEEYGSDSLQPLRGIKPEVERAIEGAMRPRVKYRTKTMAQFISALNGNFAPAAPVQPKQQPRETVYMNRQPESAYAQPAYPQMPPQGIPQSPPPAIIKPPKRISGFAAFLDFPFTMAMWFLIGQVINFLPEGMRDHIDFTMCELELTNGFLMAFLGLVLWAISLATRKNISYVPAIAAGCYGMYVLYENFGTEISWYFYGFINLFRYEVTNFSFPYAALIVALALVGIIEGRVYKRKFEWIVGGTFATVAAILTACAFMM